MIEVAPYILLLLNVIIFGLITIRLMKHISRLDREIYAAMHDIEICQKDIAVLYHLVAKENNNDE